MSTPSRQLKSPGSGTVALMGSCYALGTFADNFYKQAAILIAASAQITTVQSCATVLFSLPFVLFSCWAGWLADRAAKKHIVIAAKTLELLAMLVGGVMLITLNWTGILIVLFVMGAQSTLFSPAINGSIPENFPAHEVPRVNALIKLASTGAILAGMAFAGFFLDLRPGSLGGLLPELPEAFPQSGEGYGRSAAALFILGISVIGLLTAFGLRGRPAASGTARAAAFPLGGPLDSFRHLRQYRKDEFLYLALLADAWFFGIAAIAVISIANLVTGLGYSNTLAGAMSAVLMVGVASGSLLAGRYQAESWQRLLMPSACGMSLLLLLVGLTPLFPPGGQESAVNMQLCWLAATLFCCGVCGGVYLIPLESYIQVRPAPEEKGRVIGLSNFMSFMAMAIFGAVFQIISLLPPALTFPVYGFGTLAFILGFARGRIAKLPGRSMRDAASSPLSWLLRSVLWLRYAVEEHGLDALPAPSGEPGKPGVLFLPNHPALIDPVIIYSRLAGMKLRPLADARQMRGPLQSLAACCVGAVTIADLEQDGKSGVGSVRSGIRNITEALRQGRNVYLSPAGRIYRSPQEELRNSSAAARILAAVPEARVVLVRTSGLWGSSFSRANGKIPVFMAELGKGLLTVLANGIFFTPRRKVRIEFIEPEDLPRDGDKRRLNRYLEAFFNRTAHPAVSVPRYFWQK